MGKRLEIARLLEASGIVRGVLSMRRIAPLPWLPVLTYHRVRQPSAAAGGVVDATPGQFERQVAFLSRSFRFISTADLVAWLDGARLPPNPVLLTFDDGYVECVTEVLPILKRHGARATFFVSTGYVGGERPFWWDLIRQLVERSPRERLVLTYPSPLVLPLGDRWPETADRLAGVVKTRVGLDLDRFLEHVAEASGAAWPQPGGEGTARVMDWGQARELVDAGMEVQSHTRHHRVLHTLSPAQVVEELEGSRDDLEQHLDVRVQAIAYPVGFRVAHLPHVRAALRATGYRVGFTSGTGINPLWRGDPYDLRRVGMDLGIHDALFRAMMALPPLAPGRAGRVEPAAA